MIVARWTNRMSGRCAAKEPRPGRPQVSVFVTVEVAPRLIDVVGKQPGCLRRIKITQFTVSSSSSRWTRGEREEDNRVILNFGRGEIPQAPSTTLFVKINRHRNGSLLQFKKRKENSRQFLMDRLRTMIFALLNVKLTLNCRVRN